MLDHEGKEVPGNRGYKYFGAAKDLPGVRELFEIERKLSKMCGYLYFKVFKVEYRHWLLSSGLCLK